MGQKTPAVLGNPLEDDLDRIPRKGIVKLGDFGIARVLDSSTAGAQTTIGPGVQGSAPEGGVARRQTRPWDVDQDCWFGCVKGKPEGKPPNSWNPQKETKLSESRREVKGKNQGE